MAEQATVVIQATDQASLVLKTVGQEIQRIGNNAVQATSEARAFATGGLAIAGAATGAAYALYRMGEGFVEAAKQGEQLNKTAVALERQLFQSGESAGEFRRQMKDATGGETTSADLDKLAFKVRRMGYEWEQIPALLAAAKSQADIAGEDVATTTEQLGAAMAAGSAKGLRQFGILIDKTTILAEAARKAGIPVGALTDEQERSALISAGMAQLTGKLTDSVNGLGSAAERAQVRWTDAINGIKKTIGGGVPDIFGAETAGVFEGKDTVQKQAEAAKRVAKLIQDARADAAKELKYQEGRGFFGSEEALERVRRQVANLSGQEGEMFRAIKDNLIDLGAQAQATAEKMRALDLSKGAGSAETQAWIASLDKQEEELLRSAEAVRALGKDSGALGLPLLSAADAAEAMAVRLGEQRGRLEEVQAAYRATPELLKAWQAELYDLQVAGEGASERAKDLELWSKVATDATKQVAALTDALGGFLETSKALGALQKALPPDTDPVELARVANAMEQVQAAQKALDESIAKGEGAVIQRGRLEALSGASLQYIEMMKRAGVDGRALDEVQQMLVESASRYQQRLYRLISEGSVFQALTADARELWAAMAGPAGAFAAAQSDAQKELNANLAAVKAAEKALKDGVKPKGGGRSKDRGLDEFEAAELTGERAAEANAEYMAMIDADKAYYAERDEARQKAMAEKADVLTRGLLEAQEARLEEEQRIADEYAAAWAGAGSIASTGWSQAMSGMSSAMQIAGMEMTQFWSTTMQSIGDLTSNAIGAIGGALAGKMDAFASGLSGGLSALVPILSMLTGSARVAAGVIGGIALAAAAVFALTGFGWTVAGPLAALGASLVAYSLVPQKKTGGAMATAPSVTSAAAASSGTQAPGNITIVQYYSGAPIITGEQIADFTARGLRGMVGLGITAPREVLPA